MIRGLITAMRTLTTVPLPGKDTKRFSSSLYFFPFVGILIGWAVGASVYFVDRYTGWKELAAVVGVLVSVRATGCLHLDGLADVGDSFGVHDREKKLAVMKDSRAGVFGVVFVSLSLLFKYICLSHLDSWVPLLAVPVVFGISRTVQVAVMASMPYARAEGTAGAFIQDAGLRHVVATVILSAVYAWFFAAYVGLVVLGVGLCVAGAVRFWARCSLGGVTGDVIGFASELAEILGLVIVGVVLG